MTFNTIPRLIAPGSFGGRAIPAIDRAKLADVYVLRLLDSAPLSGGEVAHHLRPLAGWLGEPRPVFPLLHRLTEKGWLVAETADRPTRYLTTEKGRDGASALAASVAPATFASVEQLLTTARQVLPTPL